MKIFQVYLINKEFIGQSKNAYDEPKLYLRDAVTVSRRLVPSPVVQNAVNMQVNMMALKNDPDYLSTNVLIHTGPNVLILELNPDGNMAKQYLDTIKIPNKEMN